MAHYSTAWEMVSFKTELLVSLFHWTDYVERSLAIWVGLSWLESQSCRP